MMDLIMSPQSIGFVGRCLMAEEVVYEQPKDVLARSKHLQNHTQA